MADDTPDWAQDTPAANAVPDWAVDNALPATNADPERPLDNEGFWQYQKRQLGNDISNYAGGIKNSVAGGASALADVVDGHAWDGQNTASNKLQGDIVQGNWSQIPKDIAGRINEGFASNPAGKIIQGIGGIAGAPVAPFVQQAVSGLDKIGIPKEFTELGLNASPLLAKGFGAEEAPPANVAETAASAPEAVSGDVRPMEAPEAKSLVSAKNILNTVLKEEGITPEDIASSLESANKTGLPVSALDVAQKDIGGVPVQGRQLTLLAKAASNTPGEASTIAGNLAARGLQARQRIGSAFDSSISDSPYYDIHDDAIQAMQGSGKLYDQAYAANPDLMTPTLKRLLNTNAGKSALSYAADRMNAKMSLMGTPDADLAEQAKLVGSYTPGGISKGFKLQTWDYIKQALDEQADQAYRSGEKGKAADINAQKKQLVKELDANDATRQPNQPGSGMYAQARAVYSTPARVKDSLEQGRGFMQMDPEEIQSYMKDDNVSDPEKMAFATGARRALQDRVDSMQDGRNPVNSLWTQALRDRLRPMFKDDASFRDFSGKMQHEQTMARNNSALIGGSQTNQLGTYQDMINQQSGINPAKIAKAIINPQGAAVDLGLGAMSKVIQNASKNMSKETAAHIMRYLASSDPSMWRDLAKPTTSPSAAFAKKNFNTSAVPLLLESPENSQTQQYKEGGLVGNRFKRLFQ